MGRERAVFVRIAPYLLETHPHPRDLLWPVSMLYARSLLALEGVDSLVLDTWVEQTTPAALAERISASRPHYLFLQTRTPTAALTLELASRLRARHPALRIFGVGQHASEQPEDFLFENSPFEACLAGELEPIVPALIRGDADIEGLIRWKDGKLEGREARAMVLDPDALPILEPAGLPLDRYRMLSLHVPLPFRPRWGYLLTSRGCPQRCIFCSPTLRQSYGTAFRGQSPERVADELDFLSRHHGIRAFYAIDDLFTGDKARVHDICDAILKRGLKVHWSVQTRIDQLDRDLLRHMRAAGCAGIKVGIESGSPRVIRLLEKNLDHAEALRLGQEMRRLGLELTACFMLGNPTETAEEMEETFRFARRLGALMIQVAYHTPYPGSASYERFARGRAQEVGCHYGTPINLSAVSDEDLTRIHRNFYLRYYLQPTQLLRYVRHRALYRFTNADELELLFQTARYLALEGVKRRLEGDHAHPLET